MLQNLYTNLKRLEKELYLELNRDRRNLVRRICSEIFASSENLLSGYEFSSEQETMLEGIKKFANTIDDGIIGDFDRVKANEWLVKPYILELEKRASELGITVLNEFSKK